jgi:hypothetical protein
MTLAPIALGITLRQEEQQKTLTPIALGITLRQEKAANKLSQWTLSLSPLGLKANYYSSKVNH